MEQWSGSAWRDAPADVGCLSNPVMEAGDLRKLDYLPAAAMYAGTCTTAGGKAEVMWAKGVGEDGRVREIPFALAWDGYFHRRAPAMTVLETLGDGTSS